MANGEWLDHGISVAALGINLACLHRLERGLCAPAAEAEAEAGAGDVWTKQHDEERNEQQ
jgi:hypothetical protein